MDSEDLVTVFTVGNSIKAEIVKNALEAEGIRCFLENANQADLQNLITMDIKIQVPAPDAARARELIEENEARLEEEEESEDSSQESGANSEEESGATGQESGENA